MRSQVALQTAQRLTDKEGGSWEGREEGMVELTVGSSERGSDGGERH